MSNLRKKLSTKLREKKDSKPEDKSKPIIANSAEKDTKKKPEDEFDPLTMMNSDPMKDKKNKDDPLELLGILEDKKKQEKEIIAQKEKTVPKPIIANNNPKPAIKPTVPHPSSFLNSSKQPNNKINANNKVDSTNILKNINKQHEVKIAFSSNVVPPPYIQKEETNAPPAAPKKEESQSNQPNQPSQPSQAGKFGVPTIEGQKKARYLKRLTDSKARLKKQEEENKKIKTSEQITEKAKNLEGVIGHTFLEQGEKKEGYILSGLSDVKQLDDIDNNKKEDNKVKPKHVNLEDLLKQENNK